MTPVTADSAAAALRSARAIAFSFLVIYKVRLSKWKEESEQLGKEL
jgi:hypothetical protein